jgi:hypothetical protein
MDREEAVMSEAITLDQLRTLAELAGLRLSREELERLLPSVNRSRSQASELRLLVSAEIEPAATFSPGQAKKLS